MPDYKHGNIYCIRSHKTDQIYIGSTTQTLCRRMTDHRSRYNRYLESKCFYTSFEILKLGDAYIELLELCPCTSNEELDKIEGKYVRKMNCVNMLMSGRTQKKHNKTIRDKSLQQRQNNYKDRIVSLFVFTSNTDDCIANSELRRIIKDDKIALSLLCVKRILMGYGAMNWRTNKVRGMKCLRIK